MSRFALLVVLLTFASVAPASAQTQLGTDSVADAAEAFRSGDPVYVDPDARGALPESQEQGLEEEIQAAGGGIYLAVFPEGVGTHNAIGQRIIQQTRQQGTYGVVIGDRLEAASSELRDATRIADEAAAPGRSASQVLSQFVTSVDESRSGGSAGNRDSRPGGGGGFLVLLGLLAAVFGVSAFLKGRRRKRAQEEEMEDLHRVATEDLLALGGDIRALDLDIEMPGVSSEAKQRYGEAVEAYTRAEEALDRARSPKDFEPIGKELEEGRYDMAASRALLEGEPEPERRPPCFFDPRHGPSVADVDWAPAGGELRPVPVCAADAVRLEDGEEPMSREIVAGGQRMPYWQAPGQFAPFYAGGMFGGFGGLATGMLFGSMLGGMYGGWGVGDAYADGGGFGDGDFGGGDFGGGDFGGGFGGGDFGGGGFGGGDFG